MALNIEENEPQRMPKFMRLLNEHGKTIRRKELRIVQVNMGKLCNQACRHCHVEAGPQRLEIMERETMDRILELLAAAPQIQTVDITGGAPELNPNFRYFVENARNLGRHVIDRCNLTVLFEPGQEDMTGFFREHEVEIIASLPCYTKENVDKQRGLEVYVKSIEALLELNLLGYGKEDTGLNLNLVYNPGGAYLPGDQRQLESDFKEHLGRDHGIIFNHLYTIANMPIKRFENFLIRENFLDAYQDLLVESFNADVATDVMCRELVSIGWNGTIYDCDFNQMLDISAHPGEVTIWDINGFSELDGKIVFGDHCFACTAGSGSSCGGALD